MGSTEDLNMDAESQTPTSATQVAKQDVLSSEESDYSEDEGDGIQSLYSTVPEDLGFTLLGLNFPKNDLRIMRRLRLDLDTFMSLSEKELVEIGIKESVRIKRQITKNVQGKQIFNRPKKSFKLTRDEMKILGSSLASQISELNLLLANVNVDVNIKKPSNFREFEGFSSLEIFREACLTVLRQARETRKCLESLSRKVGFPVTGDDGTEGKKIRKVRKKKTVQNCVLLAAGSVCVFFAIKKMMPSVSWASR